MAERLPLTPEEIGSPMSTLRNSFFRPEAVNRPPNRTANSHRLRSGSTSPRNSTSSNSTRALASRAVRVECKLVQRAITGDLQAQEELFATHAASLYRTAFSVLRNKEDAEDAVQNGLYSAFTKLHSFQGRSLFSTWLTRIVINSALMILRKNRSLHEVSVDSLETDEVSSIFQLGDTSPNPEESFQERELKKFVKQAICCLRPRIRAVVELGQQQELSLKATAQALGISVEAAKGRLFHARAALRKSASLRAIAKATVEPSASIR